MDFSTKGAMKLYFYKHPSPTYPFYSANINPSPPEQWKGVVFVCTAPNILEADKLAKKYGHEPQKLLLSTEVQFLPLTNVSTLLWYMFFVKEH